MHFACAFVLCTCILYPCVCVCVSSECDGVGKRKKTVFKFFAFCILHFALWSHALSQAVAAAASEAPTTILFFLIDDLGMNDVA